MLGRVRVDEVLERMGGVATRDALVDAASRAAVDRALRCGEIVSVARGRYALPAAGDAVAAAHRVSGVLSLTSAALHHGWEVKTIPDAPHVSVPRKRRPSAAQMRGLSVHYADLLPEQVVDGIATGPELTLEQCMRQLPDDEALAIADSALRHHVTPSTLRRIAAAAQGPGAQKIRTIAAAARAEAANPFESVLRWIAGTVPGLRVEPQRVITLPSGLVRPDLVDDDLRIVLEADSFEWHGGRSALARDARRYNQLVAAGWIVLRFVWEDVMFDQEQVRSVLVATVALVSKPAQPPCPRCPAA